MENDPRSRKFGIERHTLRMTRRSARPIVALARHPGPKQPAVQFTSRRVRAGPLTITTCAAPDSVPVVLWQLPFSLRCARTAATTTGMYSRLQPAITALIATCSAVTVTSRVGTVPITTSGSSSAAARNSATSSGVGGTTGQAVGPAALVVVVEQLRVVAVLVTRRVQRAHGDIFPRSRSRRTPAPRPVDAD